MGNTIDKVIDGLYVGGFMGANNKEALREHGITHVLAIHDSAKAEFPEDFEYKCIKVADSSSSDLTVYFADCVDFIHKCRLKGGSAYVHCAAGISRSVTITVMYLMTVSSFSFEESLTVVQYCREMANPNYGFRLQLKRFEEDCLAEERQRVRETFPESSRLSDDLQLGDVLQKAREKFGQKSSRRSNDPFPFDPDAFSSKKSD